MSKLLDRLFSAIDKRTEASARKTAQQFGRRSFLAKAGVFMAGAVVVPLLPFDRSLGGMAMAAAAEFSDDEGDCQYWRHCALDGSLCSASGGTLTSCPPGSEASKVAWVGTCRNPNDGKDYLVSYNDCCGKATVESATTCFRSDRERPGYRMGLHNDINWCMANTNKGYHCTVSVVVGQADA
jgi:methylamine dehydrogenase light chain